MAPILSRPQSAGDIMIDCKPLLHVIKDQYKAIHCDQCLKRLNALKKCSNCKLMYYCDQSCQRIDWEFHRNECNLYSNQKFDSNQTLWRERLCLRLWLCLQSDQSFATKRYELMDGSHVCLNEIEVKTKQLRDDIERMLEFKLFSNHLIALDLKFDEKQLFHWFAFVSTNSSCNTILYYEDLHFCVPIAVGIYVQFSHLKHSCSPNAAIVSNGLSNELRAMRTIPKGEEITISYIDLCLSKTERQSNLKRLYYIDCKCNKCQLNLDSNINYKKFHKLFKTIINDSIIMNLTHVKHDWNKSNKTCTQILAFYEAIYGQYCPQLTMILMLLLNVKFMLPEEPKESVLELCKRVDRNIRITHGEKHQLYKQFTMFCMNFVRSSK